MPDVETILLICVAIAALLGGLFSKLNPGVVAILVAFAYLAAAFVLFDRAESLWLVVLLGGFALAGVTAMAASFAGRALSKLLPQHD